MPRSDAAEAAGDASAELGDAEHRILDAVLAVLADGGLAGVSMRAVARRADVALGLINYHFHDKTSLIAAALRRLGDDDILLVAPEYGLDPVKRLRAAFRHVADDEFLRTDYLGLRLQLWSLARVDPIYAEINRQTQLRYREGLVELIAAARPDLDDIEVRRRAADVLIVQNGMWLTSILIVDPDAIERSIHRCEEIALGS